MVFLVATLTQGSIGYHDFKCRSLICGDLIQDIAKGSIHLVICDLDNVDVYV